MASVWVARLQGKHGFEKLFAIKTILPEFASDMRFRQMFLDEARIASRIEHTNVAHIIDLGEQHDILYLVMEWVDGDSLSKLFRTVQRKGLAFPERMLLRIISDTCGGLHTAHELASADGKSLGVVHRDVSPQNILVSSLGAAKLIDFGIAKARDRLGEDTSGGLLKGKLHYMAPEQATGGTVDRRADIFAIGAILYHLLAGKPPYEGTNQRAILARLISAEPPAPLPSHISPPVASLILRALERDPDKRFPTAGELQAAIEAAMVESRLQCTAAEVARFANEHFAERAAKRKESIDLAIAAAAERHRVRELLRPPPSDATMTGAATSSGPIEITPASLRQAAAAIATPLPSAATLGSATMDSSIPIDVDAPPGKRKLLMLLGAGVAVIGIGVALLLVARSGPAAAAGAPSARALPPSPMPSASASASAVADTRPIASIVPDAAVVSVDSLPRPATVATAVGTARPTSVPTITGRTRKHRVNDGF